MNPILDEMYTKTQKQAPEMGQVRSLYDAYRRSSDPGAYLRTLVNQNPMLAQIARSGSLQDTFYSMCRQKGIDPNSILSQLK